jgi:hypothetical protein
MITEEQERELKRWIDNKYSFIFIGLKNDNNSIVLISNCAISQMCFMSQSLQLDIFRIMIKAEQGKI